MIGRVGRRHLGVKCLVAGFHVTGWRPREDPSLLAVPPRLVGGFGRRGVLAVEGLKRSKVDLSWRLLELWRRLNVVDVKPFGVVGDGCRERAVLDSIYKCVIGVLKTRCKQRVAVSVRVVHL